MRTNKGTTQRLTRASILSCICACTVLLGGCATANNENQGTTPTAGVEATTPAPTATATAEATTPAPTSVASEQSNTTTGSTTGALPAGVTVKRVIKEISINNEGYHKKIELLTDGGKRITITDANQNIVLQQIEYEGKITAVNGKQVTVKVDGGAEQTITIPEEVIIEDEDHLGLNKGVEIEWTVNADGQIESVELED